MISKSTETKVVEMMNWLPGSYKAAFNELLQEAAKMERELQLAQRAEQHLKSAENALAEKDRLIVSLHEQLGTLANNYASKERQLHIVRTLLADKESESLRLSEEISRRGEHNDFLDKELQRVNHALAEVTKRNKSLADEVLKWQAIVEQKNADSKTLTEALGYAKKRNRALVGRFTQTSSSQIVASLREERDKYRETLRDLVGTLNARADHDSELAGAVKSVLNG